MARKSTKVRKVMDEYKRGKLHSGSKSGPVVKNPKQAVAIAMKESGQNRSRKAREKRLEGKQL